jgi:hypothetical protein
VCFVPACCSAHPHMPLPVPLPLPHLRQLGAVTIASDTPASNPTVLTPDPCASVWETVVRVCGKRLCGSGGVGRPPMRLNSRRHCSASSKGSPTARATAKATTAPLGVVLTRCPPFWQLVAAAAVGPTAVVMAAAELVELAVPGRRVRR